MQLRILTAQGPEQNEGGDSKNPGQLSRESSKQSCSKTAESALDQDSV